MSDSKQAPDWERQFHEAAMTYRVATIVQAPRAFEELLRLARQPAAPLSHANEVTVAKEYDLDESTVRDLWKEFTGILANEASKPAPSVEQDERGLAPTFGIPLFEDMRRALEHVECVYRLNFVTEGEPSSTLANLQRVIKRIHTESVEQDERGACPCAEDAAIAACALMIKGICMTKPQAEWTKGIEERIRFMLKRASK